jgi:hypothetical protein
MDGMELSTFKRKLSKLNSVLRVQNTDIVYPHKDYPICGLYSGLQHRYIMAVPQHFVPKYSIAGVDLKKLVKDGKESTAASIIEKGITPDGVEVPEELLWRGYLAILTELCRKGLIDRTKAQREFKCDLPSNRLEYPKHYIQMVVD